METRTYTVYKFNELPPEAQQKAIQNLCDINVDHDWWDCIYEDAKNIGLQLKGFDLDRGKYCKGELIDSPRQVMLNIIKEHGESCETYKTAKKYLLSLDSLDIDAKDYGDQLENLIHEFTYDLLEDYRTILTKDYEYLTSDEAIKESLISNDYDFTIDGKID